MSLFLPARNQVIALFHDHPVHLGKFVGTVLQVGIHGKDHIARGIQETDIEGCGLAVIPAEFNPLHTRVDQFQLLYNLP